MEEKQLKGGRQLFGQSGRKEVEGSFLFSMEEKKHNSFFF